MSIVSPGPDNNPREGDDLFDLAHRASDRQWHMLTGACGGCGSAHCHPGPCPQNSNGHCLACDTRRETGEVRA